MAIIGLACLPLLLRLSRGVRNTILLAGAVYLTGAIGVELLGEGFKYLYNGGESSKLYTLLFTTEELMEMLGVVILLHAIHMQFAINWASLRLPVAAASDPPANIRPRVTASSNTEDHAPVAGQLSH